eukprot:scaffold285640_cov37-Attheya_sp.AAC.2
MCGAFIVVSIGNDVGHLEPFYHVLQRPHHDEVSVGVKSSLVVQDARAEHIRLGGIVYLEEFIGQIWYELPDRCIVHPLDLKRRVVMTPRLQV